MLFSGINPSLYSAATGHHFARPGNRFWPALHRCGFTPRQLHPAEQDDAARLGLGITNVVARATARADELTPQELVDGGAILTDKLAAVPAALGGGARRDRVPDRRSAGRRPASGRSRSRSAGARCGCCPTRAA